jgi:DNA-binding transcriptional MerR regulator
MPEKKSQTLNLLKNNLDSSDSLPAIPEKRYFTIGEAATLCGVKPHVLRYWEQEFLQLKPSKRRGNRRYYQYKDVLVVRQIRKLLYEDGYTIEGARGQLAGSHTMQTAPAIQNDESLQKLIADLENVLHNLKSTETVT